MSGNSRTGRPRREDDWEDIDDYEDEGMGDEYETPASNISRSSSPARRRRRTGQRPLFVAAAPSKPHSRGATSQLVQRTARAASGNSSTSSRTRPRQRDQTTTTTEDVTEVLRDTGVASARYAFSVFSISTRFMKYPLAVFLFLYLLALILGRVSSQLQTALQPLCYIPGVSFLCSHPSPYVSSDPGPPPPPQWADFPRLVDMQGQTFEALLDESADNAGLSLEIKKAEMATADLATLVRVSDLASRERLADILTDFVGDARDTSRQLQRFSAQVNGALDSVMAVNDHALHTIEAAEAHSKSVMASVQALIPFAATPEDVRQAAVTTAFASAMSILSSNMERLQLEAQTSLMKLDRLEARLGTLHELVKTQDASLSDLREEILAKLWTKLGGNKRDLRGTDKHRALLAGIGAYRARALAHVVTTLQALQGYAEDMEVLRTRVATPSLAEDIPLEVHVRSIGAGLRRLQDRSIRAEARREEITSAAMRDAEREIGAA
ncbi:hypothetical protein PENSPDRAFT_757644 [Peniophora sp. CONT]|nr:hypothetical protein PENSPDRAFT_757644 [Peniophora sp. CONT]